MSPYLLIIAFSNETLPHLCLIFIFANAPDHHLAISIHTHFTYLLLHSACEIRDIPDTILPLLFGVLLLMNGLSCVNGRTALISLSTFTNQHSYENKIEQLCISCLSSSPLLHRRQSWWGWGSLPPDFGMGVVGSPWNIITVYPIMYKNTR